MKRTITAGLIGAIALATAALASHGDTSAGGHAQQPGVAIKQLALATIGERVRAGAGGIQLRTDGPKVMMTASIALEPGASLGWHSHPGPVQVAVTRGRFSLIRVENRRCRTRTFGPGGAFVENGRRVHLGRNAGSEPVRLFATFLAPSGTTAFSQPEETPEPCR